MVRVGLRSKDAIELAKSALPNVNKFLAAEQIMFDILSEHVLLASSGEPTCLTAEVEAKAAAEAEVIDPGHQVRRMEFKSLLEAADEVVDGCLPIRHRTKPPWGRAQ